MKDQDRMGHHTSLWSKDMLKRKNAALQSSARVDVCVIGAGIAGLSVAWHLVRHDLKVMVLDDGPVGGGQTIRTSAHLSNAIDDRYTEIERLHGGEGSRLAAESHTAAIHRIESIVAAEKMDCDFTRLDGYLFVPPYEDGDILEDELAAAHRAGLVDVELVARCPEAPFDTGRALRFPRQAQFNPILYLRGLKRAIEREGGKIYNGTHVKSIEGGEPCTVKIDDALNVTADHVVVATNTPINDMYAIHTKQAPYMTYVIGMQMPRGTVQPVLLWDTMDPYHYVRLQTVHDKTNRHADDGSSEHDVLIVGGEDQKTAHHDDGAERYARLEAWARERFPMAGDVEYRWSGQVMETVDGLAYIGRNPGDDPHVYIATGDSGMGLTHGTIAGMLISDLILGHDNPWVKLYEPSRKSIRAAWEFTKENLDVAAQYAHWLNGSDVESTDDIEPGHGAVVRRGRTKIAAYRDEHGVLHEMTASCPHLGCPVAWNSDERTWDCGCHGSRFDCLGHVMNGPANVNLEMVSPPTETHAAK